MGEHIETVESLIAAWKRRDPEAVLALLTDDVVYHYHVGARPLIGKDRVRRFLHKFGEGQKDIRWRIVHHAQNGNVLLVEGIDDYVDAEGRRIQTPYMGVFEFRDERICGWRDYLDAALAERARQGEPHPEWVQGLIDAPPASAD
jgi:limonene-1,2-epoxide hydrolase